jgi:hypothetical protein
LLLRLACPWRIMPSFATSKYLLTLAAVYIC